jgi:hypothetical protein
MARTLEELQAQRDKIIADMGGPERVDGPAGMGATFRSQEQLEAALLQVDREIARVGGSSSPRQIVIVPKNV